MEFLTFNRNTNELLYKDNLTTFIDRVSFKVLTFTIQDGRYVFVLDPHQKLKFSELHFPIENTVLSIV